MRVIGLKSRNIVRQARLSEVDMPRPHVVGQNQRTFLVAHMYVQRLIRTLHLNCDQIPESYNLVSVKAG